MSIPEEEHTESAEAEPKQEKQELKREIMDFVKLVVWFLVIFLGLRSYVIEGYEVQGPSMKPTLEDNQRILVLKLPHILSQFSLFSGLNAIEPGDIVVFDSPDAARKRYVKRVIAMGPKRRKNGTVAATSEDVGAELGESVKVNFRLGTVYVNNVRLEEDYLPPEAKISNDRQELILEPGQYYVLGDNRRVSKDSRSFQAVRDDQIIGKAILRFWPPHKIELFP